MECPQCNCNVRVSELHFPTFACPKCQRVLQVSEGFQIPFRILGAVIGFTGCYLFGLRGLALIGVGAVVSFALGSVLTIAGIATFNPKLSTYIRDGSLGLH